MNFRKKANKALALILSLSLAMSTNMPISALANEAAAPETESAAAEITYVMSGEEAIGINLNANPVVIQEAVDVSGNTVPGYFNVVYDANRNGKVDAGEEKLAIEGETAFASTLNVYGIYNEDTDKNILITMNSGTVEKLYGAYSAEVWSTGDSVSVVVNGGKISSLQGFYGYDYGVDGRVYVKIGEQAVVETLVASNSYNRFPYYVDNQGAVEIYGDYTMTANEEYSSLRITDGMFVVPKGLTLTADEIYLAGSYGYGRLLLRGTMDVESVSSSYSAKLLVDGGTLPENYSFEKTFYPFNLESNLGGSPLTPGYSSDYDDYTENGVTTRFVVANKNVGFSYAAVAGYDCYYSTDGVDYKDASSTFYLTTPAAESMKLELLYVPKPITVENNYSAPKGVVGQTYTEGNPLCDLSTYPIKNDTTEEYGGEVKYAVKKSTSLPEGLSLVKGKIVGTPAKACEEGQKVTFAVTGRNGSTTNFDLTIKIVDSGYTKKDINDLYESGVITYQSYKMDLGGTSVVLQGTSASSEYFKIYLDDDQDGLPDNNSPLVIDGDDEIRLGRIYGYSNTEKAYDGDIRITVKSGKLVEIYGINGDSANCENQTEKSPTVTVNGDVSIYTESLTMNSTSSNIFGAKNGAAKNVTVDIKGGSFTYTDVIGVDDYSNISGDVNCNYGGKAIVKSDSDQNIAIWGIAKNSSVAGNVNAVLGFENSADYGFIRAFDRYMNYYYSTSFTGVSETSVGGDINYTINGRITPAEITMVSGKTVGGNVNFECTTGALYCYGRYVTDTYLINGTTVTGALCINSPEESSFNCDTWALLTGNASVSDIYMNYPASCTGDVEIKTIVESGSSVKNSIFMNNKGVLTVRGDYTIAEDASYKGMSILENTKLTIEEGVKVEVTGSTFEIVAGSTLTNKGELKLAGSSVGVVGTLDNKGTLSTATFKIAQTGVVINEEGAAWVLGGALTNSGKIVNYGVLSQTYKNANDSHLKLGTVYTSGTMSLSEALSEYTYIYGSTPYSTFYVKVNVNYPRHCLSSVTLAGERISSSGLTGDTNQYIKVDMFNPSEFTITLGEQKLDDVVLEGVTYGPEATAATSNDNVVWNASIRYVYEPFDVTVNYEADGGVTPITLAKTEDTVTGLAVDQVYTYEQPLYDLTNIAIVGDITAENGKAMYSVREGNLPDGILLKDGKLYGRFSTATDEQVKVEFDVQGLNLTKAGFTLTFDPVAKAVPQWSVPTGFTTTIQSQVQDIELPTSEKGTYAWASVGESVGSEVGTITTSLIFTPEDTDNYDWAAAAQAAGIQAIWDEENQTIICVVSVQVEPGEPEVTAPTGLTAIYGQTFADIAIPADKNGTFEWDTDHHALTDVVGEVGDHTCYVTYVPTNKNYKTKSGVEVTLTVNQATPDYKETLTEVELFCDETLGDVLLPDAEGGRYQWVSATTTEPEDGASYQVIYIPEDTVNYDWTTVTGWNKMRKGIVFSVTVKLEHAWGEGKVTKPATEEAEGEKTYSCGLCGETRTEAIPKLPNSGGGNGGTIAPQPPVTPQPPKVGYPISDSSSKAVYKVSKVGAEVTYVKPDKKTYTKVKVPKTVKYEGVTYKVTAIANGAFKKNTKMTKVTIGANVKSIGNSAFQGCTSLKSVTIPKNVTKIGKKAFFGCKKLMKMTIKTTKLTEKSVGKKAFTQMGSSNYKKLVVKVPKKQKKAYTKWLKKRGLNKNAKIK